MPTLTTQSDTPASTGVFESPESGPQGSKTGGEGSSLHPDPVTLRDHIRSAVQAARAFWVPPALLTCPPPSVADLASYARSGAWTSQVDGPIRRLGVWWYRLVTLPVTVVCRYTEWVAQRPGRAVAVFVVWKLVTATGPGPWLVDHTIRPVLGLVAWVLL